MPRRQEHLRVATVVGFATGVVTAPPAMAGGQAVAYMAGCVVGARFGGRLPDVLEPPHTPRHRAFFHSQMALTGATKASIDPPLNIKAWRQERLDQANALKLQREALRPDDPRRTSLWIEEMLNCLLAGCIAGWPVGYVTHLLQDAGTSTLPFI